MPQTRQICFRIHVLAFRTSALYLTQDVYASSVDVVLKTGLCVRGAWSEIGLTAPIINSKLEEQPSNDQRPLAVERRERRNILLLTCR